MLRKNGTLMDMTSESRSSPIIWNRPDAPAFAVARTEAERQRLKRAAQAGHCERADRGLYLINANRYSTFHEFAAIAARRSETVICLESAAAFHGLTTAPPSPIQIGIPRRAHPPRWSWPAVEAVTLNLNPDIDGIDTHEIEGIPVKITSAARTVAECLAYPKIVTPHSFQEIIWTMWRKKSVDISQIHTFAKHLGVDENMSLYLSTLQGP